MANPNIVGVTTILGNNAQLAVTTSAQALVNNPASSGKIFKVNTLRVTNVDAANSADVTVSIYSQDDLGGTARKFAHTITVPIKSSILIIDKDSAEYLKEDQSIGVTASANSRLEATASWEEIN